MVDSGLNYSKPRILLVDLPESATVALQRLGLNVKSGTFGPIYSVRVSDAELPSDLDLNLPDFEEQEIVVLDNSSTQPIPYPKENRSQDSPVARVSSACDLGLIDTRPWAMRRVQSDSDRILEHGGLFIVFASMRYKVNYMLNPRFFPHSAFGRELMSNWCFLSLFDSSSFLPVGDCGTEISETSNKLVIHDHLRPFLTKLKYKCAFPTNWLTSSNNSFPLYIPILQSKFGVVVASYIYANQSGGAVLILPQVEDKAELLSELFKNFLPGQHGHLFPEHEGDRWTHRVEYEHPAILRDREGKREVQRLADVAKANIDLEIDAERTRLGFLHGLLTKTGDDLVGDVKSALEFIGFNRVVDVDIEEKSRTNKQEDIQILDRSTKVLVEVKGLTGLPRESNTLQVTKFILRRLRDWPWPKETITTPHGVTLVNHQRGIPPLGRDNDNVFTKHQVCDADTNGTGLMTTWDLFRLIRGMDQWGWDPSLLQNVFYETGRIGLRPSHYIPLGTVAHYYDKPKVVSILIQGGMTLKLGDTLGYVFAGHYHEEQVLSLQVDKTEVKEVIAGQKGGYTTSLPRSALHEGSIVFQVQKSPTPF
jgi:hypothetical protein